MFEGKMVQTGACKRVHSKEKKPLPTNSDSTYETPLNGTCGPKEGEIFIAKPRFGSGNSAFRSKTLNERLEIKDSLAAVAGKSFIQTSGVNSNLEIPS